MAQDPVKYEIIQLQGGLDQVTPTLSLKPGVLRDALNVEASITGGYTRIKGYERFDGRPAPSAALAIGYSMSSVAGLAAGDAVTIGAATAVVISVDSANNSAFFTKVVGSIVIGATVNNGAPIGTIMDFSGTLTPEFLATQLGLAADVYRADIAAVPGSGPIRGVAYYGGTAYAWRDNAGATALVMHKSSSSGWVAITLPREIQFNAGGPGTLVDGNTINGQTSGATATILRVVKTTGDWAASTAAGRLILGSVTGAFTAGENIRIGVTKYAVAVAADSQVTTAPGGRVRTHEGVFVGSAGPRLYIVDGVNRAAEWDGTTYVPINTGNAVDAPERVIVHKKHLFLAFGASVQHSAVGDQYQWSAVLGAGELVADGDVTDFRSLPGSQTGGALLVASRDLTQILYGSGQSTWDFVTYTDGAGALSDTAQSLEQTYCLDDRGVIQLAQSQNFGNFDAATLTLNIRKFMQERRNLVAASGVNREKSQYRLFYSDGYGLYMTIANGKLLGSLPVLFPNQVTCWCEGESPDGSQTSFFGSTNGMVYKLDAGTSFDGASIDWTFTTAYAFSRGPRIRKRYRHASIEITGDSWANFSFGYTLSYGSGAAAASETVASDVNLSRTEWDGFTWDAFIWDGSTLLPSELSLTGTGENISFTFNGSSRHQDEFTINSLIVHYSFRRGMR